MTCISLKDFQIASGNNNAAGLQALSSVIGGAAPWPENALGIRSYGSYDNGTIRIKGDGTIFSSGFPSLIWTLSAITFEQEELIRDTYCSGGLSGEVTVRTNTDDDYDIFANYNAVLIVPKLSETEPQFRRIRLYEMRFTRLVAL